MGQRNMHDESKRSFAGRATGVRTSGTRPRLEEAGAHPFPGSLALSVLYYIQLLAAHTQTILTPHDVGF